MTTCSRLAGRNATGCTGSDLSSWFAIACSHRPIVATVASAIDFAANSRGVMSGPVRTDPTIANAPQGMTATNSGAGKGTLFGGGGCSLSGAGLLISSINAIASTSIATSSETPGAFEWYNISIPSACSLNSASSSLSAIAVAVSAIM